MIRPIEGIIFILFMCHGCIAFLLPSSNKLQLSPSLFANPDDVEESERQRLKESLIDLSTETKRGFYASSTQRTRANELIESLARINPTKEPASAYYDSQTNIVDDSIMSDRTKVDVTISGKWTLMYTNAPDITSLDSGTNLLPSIPNAKLGRIGQECNEIESTISNVIEWKKPDWVNKVFNLSTNNQDFAADKNSESRILQKVVCEAKASPKEPFIVNLDLVGFELLGDTSIGEQNDTSETNGSSLQSLLSKPLSLDRLFNGPAEILNLNPVRLRGPLKAPFGKFEILYLDTEMRIIKTGQGYYAVNVRENEMWF